MRVRTCWIILLTVLAAVVAPLEAQVVRGRLLESGSGRPIVLGRVLLLDTAYASVAETVTDEQGRFVVEAPAPGDYWIAADRLGYRPVIDGILELGAGGFLPADVYMRPEALVLEGIEITAERRRLERALRNTGFYERQKMGFGHFIDPEDIERRNPVNLSDLFQGIPPVRAGRGLGGEEFLCNGRVPRVFLDGAGVAFPELRGGQVVSSATIGQLVDVGDIAGIEVYTRPSTLPIQWSGTIGTEAGATLPDAATRARPICTILIWTKS